MPLYAPTAGGEAPNVIYGECNTPPTGNGAVANYDTFYDAAQADITGSAAAALAAIGLTYAAGVFTSTETGVWAVMFSFDPKEAPVDQVNGVELGTSMYQAHDQAYWDDATFPIEALLMLHATVYSNTSDTFQVVQTLTGTVTDSEAMTYATITITRVL